VTSRLSVPDTPADVEVRELLDAREPRSFVMVAGAGSGKTTSLVKALHHVATSQESRLRMHAQQIACITYTDIAAQEIHTDVGNNPLVAVSTIHSFMWSVTSPFQRDIRQWVISRVSEKIADLKEKQAAYSAGTRKATKDKDAAKLEKLESQQRHLPEVRNFTYGIASDFSKGVLGHEDVIRLATDLITDTDLLPRIIASKHPYIFIDESQDTYQEIVEALKRIAMLNPGKVRIGFFGDPVQQIYQRGVGHIQPEPGWASIKKPENFRNSNRVLDVINAVRSKTDDLTQAPGRAHTAQPEGEAFFFVLPATQRRDSLDQVINWLNANSTAGDWRAEGTKILTITHQMAATRLGFGRLFDAFNSHKSETLKDAFREGNAWPLRAFEDVILPLCDTEDTGSPAIVTILRGHSGTAIARGDTPAGLRLKLSAARGNVAKLHQVVKAGGAGSVKVALEFALQSGFMEPDPRFTSYLGLNSGQSDGIFLSDSTIGTLDAFMACDVRELPAYFTYIRDSSPYSTQHGTKGAEFPRVIVVIDDDDARFSQYAYDKALGVKGLSIVDLENQSSGKDSVIERTWRLLYVCVSRARESLAVVYLGDDATRSRQELENSGIAAGAQIMTVSDLA
jgi:DNA helicase II / ATP-dependent DNA helicase PcrA